MSAHRQHFTPAPERSKRRSRTPPATLLLLAAVALGFAADWYFTDLPRAHASPVRPLAQPETQVLEPLADAQQRIVHERLRIWRAGYEAALQRGCESHPLLAAPLASSK